MSNRIIKILVQFEIPYEYDEDIERWGIPKNFDIHELEKALKQNVLEKLKDSVGIIGTTSGGPLIRLPDFIRKVEVD